MDKNIYRQFALFYDKANKSDFHDKYASFVIKVIKDNKIEKVRLLDLACGTGRLIQELKLFCSIIEGVDSSIEMLKIAKNKDKKIKYYNQNFLNLNTNNKYNVIVSTFDSINYILTKKDLVKTFKKVYEHLLDDGIFIFDFNTVYKKLDKKIKKGDIVYYNLIKNKHWFATIEIKTDSGIFKEHHKERLFSFSEILSTVEESGLEVASIYSGFDEKINKVSKEQRLFLVTRRRINF